MPASSLLSAVPWAYGKGPVPVLGWDAKEESYLEELSENKVTISQVKLLGSSPSHRSPRSCHFVASLPKWGLTTESLSRAHHIYHLHAFPLSHRLEPPEAHSEQKTILI